KTILGNIAQGVCVYNKKLQLIAWNKRFIDLLNFPENFLKIGLPLREIIFFNAKRGEYGEGNPLEIAENRMNELLNSKEFQPHCYDRIRADGTYIEVR